jgi:hypothetical protein
MSASSTRTSRINTRCSCATALPIRRTPQSFVRGSSRSPIASSSRADRPYWRDVRAVHLSLHLERDPRAVPAHAAASEPAAARPTRGFRSEFSAVLRGPIRRRVSNNARASNGRSVIRRFDSINGATEAVDHGRPLRLPMLKSRTRAARKTMPFSGNVFPMEQSGNITGDAFSASPQQRVFVRWCGVTRLLKNRTSTGCVVAPGIG